MSPVGGACRILREFMPTGPDERGALLTTGEVAAHLLCDPRLRGIRTTCVLPAVRVGTEWRIRPSDLEAWIADVHRARASFSSGAAPNTPSRSRPS
jgi:hypothetical protein